MTKKGQRNLAD